MRSVLATSAILVATILVAPGGALAAPDPATTALAYLAGQQSADGSIASSAGPTEDFILGAAAANYDPNTLVSCAGTSAFDYLAANVSAETASAGGTAKLILAVLAGKQDPTAFGGQDLVARLGTFYDGTTGAYGDGSTFGQSLAILALKGDGLAIPPAAVSELQGIQDTDGSWSYLAASDAIAGDTNSTAVAVEALAAAGVAASDASMTKAITYLHGQQNSDGGFPYSGPGGSDPDSDALVIQALVALGEDPAGVAWTVGGKTVFDDLLARQASDGGFVYPGSPASDAFTTSQVPAGLKRVPLPGTTTWTADAKIPGVTCQTANPSATPGPTTSREPSATTPPTSTAGGPGRTTDREPMAPALVGSLVVAALAGVALADRRRARSRG